MSLVVLALPVAFVPVDLVGSVCEAVFFSFVFSSAAEAVSAAEISEVSTPSGMASDCTSRTDSFFSL